MGGNGVLGILRLSYNQSDPAAFEGLLKMESSDMRDDEYEGGPGTRSVSKVNYPTYPPTKAPPTSRQTYNPTAPWGVLSPSPVSTLVGWVGTRDEYIWWDFM